MSFGVTMPGIKGFIYDGRYVYTMPSDSDTGQGYIARLDAYVGPQATSMAATRAPNGFAIGDYSGVATPGLETLITSGSMGIGTSTPQYTLDVNGTINANVALNGQPLYATYYTTTNQLSTLAQGANQGFGSGAVGSYKVMSANSVTCFDLTSISKNTPYFGGAFDGRYIFLTPIVGSTVVRYDTMQPYNSAGSYTAYDLLQVSTNSYGYRGSLFDGRYIYFPPDSISWITRYDTQQPFNSSSSYTAFNPSLIGGANRFYSGIFDGRYIYFSPWTGNSTILRYDTTQPFISTSSYTAFNVLQISPQTLFGSGVYDGRYIYFVPIQGGGSVTILRYDTTLPFTATRSFTAFGLTRISVFSTYVGAVFDGRYVYGIPLSTIMFRYDTQQDFNSPGSYTVFDLTAVTADSNYAYAGGVFDGRYIYLSPSNTGYVTTYDTTRSFNAVSSYAMFNTQALNASSAGFGGAVFDGRHVYFVPNVLTPKILTRIDAYSGVQTSSLAASQSPNGMAVGSYAGTKIPNGNLIISGNFGIGTGTPTFSLQLGQGEAYKPGDAHWIINSDIRIKTNIQNISNALDTMRQLRPRKFQFHPAYAKEIKADPDATHYGFVADEVEDVIEGCVAKSSLHCYDESDSHNKTPLPDLMNLKTFNLHNILIYSIQAVKDLAERGDQLKKQIDQLSK
jgi:hypothetical protein